MSTPAINNAGFKDTSRNFIELYDKLLKTELSHDPLLNARKNELIAKANKIRHQLRNGQSVNGYLNNLGSLGFLPLLFVGAGAAASYWVNDTVKFFGDKDEVEKLVDSGVPRDEANSLVKGTSKKSTVETLTGSLPIILGGTALIIWLLKRK